MKIITLPRVLILLLAVLIIGVAFLLFAPVEPLKINSVKIEGNSFKAGSEMSFIIDRCKNVSSAVPGTATRYFVNVKDSNKPDVFISSTDDLGEKGCAVVKRSMDIPAHVKDGEYRLKFVTRYYPSVLREPVKIEYVTDQTFTIKGQEISAQLNSIMEQLKIIANTGVASTVNVPTPQNITPPFQQVSSGKTQEETAEDVETDETKVEESCLVNVGIIKLCQ